MLARDKKDRQVRYKARDQKVGARFVNSSNGFMRSSTQGIDSELFFRGIGCTGIHRRCLFLRSSKSRNQINAE